MSALITLPVRDHINGALRSALDGCGLPWLPLYGMSDLPRARSLLVSQALRAEVDRVLFIDADIVATPEQIRRLADHPEVSGEKAVTGLYALRSGKAWACHAPRTETLPDGMRLADYAGLGFACVSRESLLRVQAGLTRLKDPDAGDWWPFCVPFVQFRDGEAEYCADDVSLWRRLAKRGTTLWADTRLVVGHQALFTLHSPFDEAELGTGPHLDELGAEVDGRGQAANGNGMDLVLDVGAADKAAAGF